MPRMSIYLPDELVAQAKEFDEEGNMSQLVQLALRRYLGAASEPAYVQRPADAAQLLQTARDALISGARADYAEGFRNALRRAPGLTWSRVDAVAGHNYELQAWVEPFIKDLELLTQLDSDDDEEFHQHLIDDLGDWNQHDDQYTFKSKAYQRGYADGFRDVHRSVEDNTTPEWAVVADSDDQSPSP
jgi:hypothetical protein